MALSPSSGAQGGGTTVTITGTNFTNPSTVRFATTPATSVTFNSPTSLTAVSPAGSGSVPVTVTTPGGTGNVGTFFYVPSPLLSGLTPSVGGVGTSVVITGANLSNTTAVTFGATPATAFTVDSDGQITATTPAGTGTVPVTVTTTAGSVDNQLYSYSGTPTITTATPASGPEGGGNIISVTGTNLSFTREVTVGGTRANFGVVSPTSIAVVVPAGTGTGLDVVATTPGGTATGAGLYSYLAPPGG